MKILVALMLAASLMACGGKSNKTSTPDTTIDTTQTQPEGTGGATYGGPAAPDALPAAGGQ